MINKKPWKATRKVTLSSSKSKIKSQIGIIPLKKQETRVEKNKQKEILLFCVSFLNRGHHFKFSSQTILSWHPTLCFCEFFLLLTVRLSSSKSEIRYCLNCVYNCDDHSSLDSKSAVQHEIFHISLHQRCIQSASLRPGTHSFFFWTQRILNEGSNWTQKKNRMFMQITNSRKK